jgi:transposase
VQDQAASRCPNCKSAYEIAAVKFNALRTTSMLFVCASCALTLVDAPSPKPKRIGWFRRGAVALVAAAAVLYFATWFLVSQEVPFPANELATMDDGGAQSAPHVYEPM